MSLRARLTKAEGNLGDTLLWFEMQKLATEMGADPMQLYKESCELIDRYSHLARLLPSGQLDIEPVLRAVSTGEDLDYEDLVKEAKRTMRNLRRRRARRQQ